MADDQPLRVGDIVDITLRGAVVEQVHPDGNHVAIVHAEIEVPWFRPDGIDTETVKTGRRMVYDRDGIGTEVAGQGET